jgi:two-component system sensor histidine kinase DesK
VDNNPLPHQKQRPKEDKLLMVVGLATWAFVSWLTLRNSGSDTLYFHLLTLSGFALIFILITNDIIPNLSLGWTQAAIGLQALLVLMLSYSVSNSLLAILLIIWASLLPEFFSRRYGILLMLTVNLGLFLIAKEHWQRSDALFSTLLFTGFQFFSFSSSLAKVSEKKARQEQERLNQQLIATRSLLAQTSQQQERLRIARDLHDIIGHELTALTLQLEVLSHKAPLELKESVQQSKTLAKALLGNIRSVVREKRHQTDLELVTPLEAIVARLPGVSISCDSQVKLQSTELAQELLCVLQEGISNAVRHGKANQLHFMMQYAEHKLVISLTDNGRGTQFVPGAGLLGMQERLMPFSGVIDIEKTASGTRLQICCNINKVHTEQNNK